jgi:hypothetical protein
MSELEAQRSVTEAEVRSLKDIPDTEIAHELGRGDDSELPEGELDPHSDPEFRDFIPEAATEAAAEVTSWRVGKSLLKLREQVNAKAPNRKMASDGTIGDGRHRTRNSDHNPWITDGGIGVVTAMDITHDPANGCDAGALARSIRASADARVKYIIWNRQIANSSPINGQPAWKWRDYNGRNPHDRHVHISVKSEKTQYDSDSDWFLDDTEGAAIS